MLLANAGLSYEGEQSVGDGSPPVRTLESGGLAVMVSMVFAGRFGMMRRVI
jgi:hypothetical protein